MSDCPACAVKDMLIESLNREVEYHRGNGTKLTDTLTALVDTTAHARMAMAQAVQARAEDAKKKAPPVHPAKLRRVPDRMSDSAMAETLEAIRPRDEKEPPAVAPETASRAEIEASFERTAEA